MMPPIELKIFLRGVVSVMKQAFLIMAHHDFYILEKIIKILDYENNDLYLHVDKKVKNFDFEKFKNIPQKSKIYFTKRIDVRWGDISQIKCTYILLYMAKKNGIYQYYHLISGVDMPLKTGKEINNYFKKDDKNYLQFYKHHQIDDYLLDRMRYYYFFQKNVRHHNKTISKFANKLLYKSLKIQKNMGVNRLKNDKTIYRKGSNWFSINDDLVNFVLEKESLVMKKYKYTRCCDEIFLQTLVFNSKFYDTLKCYQDNNQSSIMRYIDWDRGQPYTFTKSDYDILINSGMLFARKFSSNVDKRIIDMIYDGMESKCIK